MKRSIAYDVILSNNLAFPDESEMSKLRSETQEEVAKALFNILNHFNFPASSKAFEALLLLSPEVRARFIDYILEKMDDSDVVTAIRRMSEEEYLRYRKRIWDRVGDMGIRNPSLCVAACGRMRDLGDMNDSDFLKNLAKNVDGLDRNGDKASDLIFDYAQQIENSYR